MADRVVVMYAGVSVEEAGVNELFGSAMHPYTEGLISSIPTPGMNRKRLPMIPGSVPDPFHHPSGCRFSDRCGKRFDRCGMEEPPMFEISDAHMARCWLCEGGGG
jgi:oligopeptide/dipeptide ABC transporter ATP-binding protein